MTTVAMVNHAARPSTDQWAILRDVKFKTSPTDVTGFQRDVEGKHRQPYVIQSSGATWRMLTTAIWWMFYPRDGSFRTARPHRDDPSAFRNTIKLGRWIVDGDVDADRALLPGLQTNHGGFESKQDESVCVMGSSASHPSSPYDGWICICNRWYGASTRRIVHRPGQRHEIRNSNQRKRLSDFHRSGG